eukprot:3331173-Rhodomonas_salina.1
MGCQCPGIEVANFSTGRASEQLAYTGRQYCTLRVANSQSKSVDGQGLCHDWHVDKTDWLGCVHQAGLCPNQCQTTYYSKCVFRQYDGVLDPNSSVDASPSTGSTHQYSPYLSLSRLQKTGQS